MLINTAIVPVAGLGTRLLPLTQTIAKELLPLAGKPTLQYVLEELWHSGVRRTILVTSPAKATIADCFRRDEQLERHLRETGKAELVEQLWSQSPAGDMRVETAIQTEQLGLGHAVSVGESLASGEPVVVALGDCVIDSSSPGGVVHRMIDLFHREQADIVIAFEEVAPERVNRFGIANPLSDGPLFQLADLIEKPSPSEAPSNLAVAARYVFSPQIFDALRTTKRGKNNEIQLTDAIRQMIHSGARAWGVQLEAPEARFDMGNLESYTESFIHFALADPHLREVVKRASRKAGAQRETD
ncbi:MAG: sugar phosphate nucleotidyltransferase [Planctomycetota bacterium]|nr:sugar phosphate nucleotidyltransferase [Planctomycetota bacterium]